jgi:hypothetical protein
VRLLVDGDNTSTTAMRVAARRGGGDRGGGATAAALLCVAPRGSAAGARCVRQMVSLQYVDVEAALGPDQVRLCGWADTQRFSGLTIDQSALVDTRVEAHTRQPSMNPPKLGSWTSRRSNKGT